MKYALAALALAAGIAFAANKVQNLSEQLSASEAYAEHLAKQLRECEAGK